jgi:hypothetical protein
MRQDWVVDSMGVEVRGRRRGQGWAGGRGRSRELHQGRRRRRHGIEEECGDGATWREAAVAQRRGRRWRWRDVEGGGGGDNGGGGGVEGTREEGGVARSGELRRGRRRRWRGGMGGGGGTRKNSAV